MHTGHWRRPLHSLLALFLSALGVLTLSTIHLTQRGATRQIYCPQSTFNYLSLTEVHPHQLTLEFDFRFATKRITNLQLVKLKPNVLRISGDWGSIFYQGIEHRIYNLHMKSPSDHKMNGVQYPMEFQYSAVSIEGTEVMISILFERNDFNPLPILYNYGLGNKAIKQLTDADTNITTATLNLNTQLSLDDFIDTSRQTSIPFYIYEGSNQNSDCGLAINMVYAEPLWMGLEQLSIFDLTLGPDYPAKDDYRSIIYQNMYNISTPMLHNATETPGKMQDTPVPGPLTHLPFLFMPEPGRPFGSINETFFAVWRDRPKDGIFIDPEIPPSVQLYPNPSETEIMFSTRWAGDSSS
jgi:carbonic anhydrase